MVTSSGPSSVVRRQKRSAPKEEPEKVDEEEWSLKDVIFVEDSPNFPMIGRVLKVIYLCLNVVNRGFYCCVTVKTFFLKPIPQFHQSI